MYPTMVEHTPIKILSLLPVATFRVILQWTWIQSTEAKYTILQKQQALFFFPETHEGKTGSSSEILPRRWHYYYNSWQPAHLQPRPVLLTAIHTLWGKLSEYLPTTPLIQSSPQWKGRNRQLWNATTHRQTLYSTPDAGNQPGVMCAASTCQLNMLIFPLNIYRQRTQLDVNTWAGCSHFQAPRL